MRATGIAFPAEQYVSMPQHGEPFIDLANKISRLDEDKLNSC